ncbi:glycosyltransferase family 4 protein [Sphingobacterium litopenaei]|uniref:Glycosyltransferase family 4 protein n=1 Tax=Sphingobacterium litopenaei TaxID=2763500 RepID=A0ABR7YEL5_9SPHI|nr:glycosyltransferase family 4 protein [Sphingobacterium litopenaei]MBD1429762.1 glycosyltransferase family 4 protein [Sphingobacterium litopenaei]
MQILIFYQYFGTPKGKWSTRMYELTKRWVDKGHKVTVVTSPYEKSDIRASKFIERQNVEGIDLVVINSADSNRDNVLKRAFKALIFSFMSCYFALTLKCDVVLASSGPITVGLPALLTKWFRKKAMIFEVRDLWPDGAIELGKLNNSLVQKIAVWFEKLCYRNSSLVIPCSRGMEQGVLKKCPNTNTLVITNASDVELFSNISEDDKKIPEKYAGKKLFLYAGSLGLMDEVEQVIEGMRLITDPNILWLVIGEGAERKHLENLVRNYNLTNVEFLGIMPKTEVIKWFSRVEASFVTFKDLPVLHTSSPNKMFDSFAAGVPIIQSTKGWIKELVSSTNCGINVEPYEPQQFSEAILKIAYDRSYRDELAVNAKLLALKNFNRDVLAIAYLNKLLEIDNNQKK